MKRFLYLMILIFSVASLAGCGDDGGGPGQNASPTIREIVPGNVSRGQANVEGRIEGTNLAGVTAVNLGEGITLHEFANISATQISIKFSVGVNASSGARAITVTTTGGTVTSSSALFTIIDNRAPRATFVVNPTTGARNTLFTFDATNSVDSDGNIAGYRWDFGNGRNGNGRVITHRFDIAGTFTVTLTVTDNDGATHIFTRNVEIKNGLTPEAKFNISPPAGSTEVIFRFDASSSVDRDNAIVDYHWEFGDGQSGNGKIVEHRYTKHGIMEVSLTVTDATGLESTLVKSLSVELDDFDDAKAISDISRIIQRFFNRYSSLDRLDAEEIVEDWSLSPECTGRDREIRIIKDQQEIIERTEATITQLVVFIHDNHVLANADVDADFRWTEKDGSSHFASAVHHFTIIFEDGKWQICNFTLSSSRGSARFDELFD